MTNQSSALNTIEVQESANYLADLFMEIENGGKEDATNTETATYTAMDETGLIEDRQDLCNELLHQLDEYVHNYRSTRITA
jgi:hypothetical protein